MGETVSIRSSEMFQTKLELCRLAAAKLMEEIQFQSHPLLEKRRLLDRWDELMREAELLEQDAALPAPPALPLEASRKRAVLANLPAPRALPI